MAGDVPEPFDFTLVPFTEVVLPLLDAVAPVSVIEVGADRGDFTRELLAWAAGRKSTVTAVDPSPPPELLELETEHPELRLVQEPSHQALPALAGAGALILDGDHNHYTLSEELRLIAANAGEGPLPLLIVHDVGWPHARRDTYYEPDRIPEEHRQSLARDAMVAPGEPGVAASGIRFPWAAEREGGARNGVLTAVEDFIEGRPGTRMAVVPAFFGLAMLWSEDASWSGRVAELLAPWDASPMLTRLEALRVAHIVDRVRLARREELLRSLLGSRSFALAERISRLRRSNEQALSRERMQRALDD